MKLEFNLKIYFFPQNINLKDPRDGWFTHKKKPTWLFRLNLLEVEKDTTNFERYALKRIR